MPVARRTCVEARRVRQQSQFFKIAPKKSEEKFLAPKKHSERKKRASLGMTVCKLERFFIGSSLWGCGPSGECGVVCGGGRGGGPGCWRRCWLRRCGVCAVRVGWCSRRDC